MIIVKKKASKIDLKKPFQFLRKKREKFKFNGSMDVTSIGFHSLEKNNTNIKFMTIKK